MHTSWIRLFLLTALTIILAACKSTPYRDYKSRLIPQEENLQIALIPLKENISVEPPPTNYAAAGFGAIGFAASELISAIKLHSQAKPNAKDIDLVTMQTAAIAAQGNLANINSLVDVQQVKASEIESLVSSNSGYTLEVKTRYSLNFALEVLNGKAYYTLWENHNGKVRKAYYNEIHYQSYPYNSAYQYLTDEEKNKRMEELYKKYPLEGVRRPERKANLSALRDEFSKINRKKWRKHPYSRNGEPWLENEAKLLHLEATKAINEISKLIFQDIFGELEGYKQTAPHPRLQKTYIISKTPNGRIVERTKKNKLISRHSDFPVLLNREVSHFSW